METHKNDILIVDDNPANLQALHTLVAEQGYEVRLATSGTMALDSACAEPPALILLDIRMPGMDGFEVCRQLKQHPATRDIPVIFISVADEIQDKIAGFQAGGVDYITRPFQSEEILVRLKSHLELRRLQKYMEQQVQERTVELQEANEALKQREKQLETFFSQSLDGCFFMMLDEPVRWDDTVDKEKILDYVFTHQRITKINDAMLAQYRATREQFLGLTPAEAFAHDIPHGRAVWHEFFDHGRLLVDTNEQKFDGTPMWIEGEYVCIYDEQGRITGHFGIQREITERKQAEEELRQHREHLEELVQERTRELEARTKELEAFNKAMIDREMRFIELKEEINRLCVELGRESKYPPVWK